MSAHPPPPRRLFALVDCSAFYCSCERAFDPSLERRPVAVLSNNDGCVIAATPEFTGGGQTRPRCLYASVASSSL